MAVGWCTDAPVWQACGAQLMQQMWHFWWLWHWKQATSHQKTSPKCDLQRVIVAVQHLMVWWRWQLVVRTHVILWKNGLCWLHMFVDGSKKQRNSSFVLGQWQCGLANHETITHLDDDSLQTKLTNHRGSPRSHSSRVKIVCRCLRWKKTARFKIMWQVMPTRVSEKKRVSIQHFYSKGSESSWVSAGGPFWT